jgi:hypothetical protein
MLILDIPYNEKDEAKRIGAKWDPNIKKWYVNDKEDYHKFVKWIEPIGNIVIIDALYLIEGIQKCFRCQKETRVIGFGIDKHLSICSLEDYKQDINQEEIHIVGPIYPIPDKLLQYLQGKYNYKMRFSKTTGKTNISNCCDYCDVLQGDFFLYNEVDSPFFIYSEEDVKELKIYKIGLSKDLIVECSDGSASFDFMFKKYGKIINLDIGI